MYVTAPTVVQDAGTWGLALAAVLAVGGLLARGLRHVIRDEVPNAMQQAVPEVTRALVRDEVGRAVEPFAAKLHEEIRKTREQMQPNGGSSFRDYVQREIEALRDGQDEIARQVEALRGGE